MRVLYCGQLFLVQHVCMIEEPVEDLVLAALECVCGVVIYCSIHKFDYGAMYTKLLHNGFFILDDFEHVRIESLCDMGD